MCLDKTKKKPIDVIQFNRQFKNKFDERKIKNCYIGCNISKRWIPYSINKYRSIVDLSTKYEGQLYTMYNSNVIDAVNVRICTKRTHCTCIVQVGFFHFLLLFVYSFSMSHRVLQNVLFFS
jgi:hypothetical protein